MMKRMRLSLLFNNGLGFFVLLCCTGLTQLSCSFSYSKLEYRRGQKLSSEKNFVEAQKHFNRVIEHDPDSNIALSAAREAAYIALYETKDYPLAIEFYQHLVRYSPTERERREAQKRVAMIYFEKMTDYQKAIDEFSKLLLLRNSKIENVEYRYYLARSYFYLNRFQEAQAEAERALKLADANDNIFEISMLLGNILYNMKKLDQAIDVYELIIKQFPERAKTENVEMNVVVCFEEQNQFDAAIARLEIMRTSYVDKDFIDLKIKRLKDRRANMPGSKGLRK